MSKLHTHYDNLKVSRDAPMGVIKAAYKALAQEHHPDRCQSPDAPRRMQIINDAYAELSNPVKRAAHDQWIKDNEKRPGADRTAARVKKADPSIETQIERLRSLHRSDLHQMRAVHAVEVGSLKRRVTFEKKLGILTGLLLSIPLHLIFVSVDGIINKAHAETVQQSQVGGSHVTSLVQTHGEASWREHTAERTTKPPKIPLGTPKASKPLDTTQPTTVTGFPGDGITKK